MSRPLRIESPDALSRRIARRLAREHKLQRSTCRAWAIPRVQRLRPARRLAQRVIGQDNAIHMIAKRIQTSRAGLENPSKPIGVFMLVGTSGVGKTEAVRRKPYSVVLLDDVKKTHPDEMLGKLVKLQLNRIKKRVEARYKIPFEYGEDVVKLVVSRCTESESGGRMIDAILTYTMLPDISREFLTRMMEGTPIERVQVGWWTRGSSTRSDRQPEIRRYAAARRDVGIASCGRRQWLL
jgi:ATP-dependent Clp protease ATP-binding subunit ClpA